MTTGALILLYTLLQYWEEAELAPSGAVSQLTTEGNFFQTYISLLFLLLRKATELNLEN